MIDTSKRSLTAALLLLLSSAATLADEPLEIPADRRQLFLDDFVVERTENLARSMHSPEKRGAVLKPDVTSDGSRVQVYGTVPSWSPADRHFKMIYMAFPMENHGEIGAALAVSKDGLTWEKPLLGQMVSVRGSTDNNRIFVDRNPRWGGNALMNVIGDPDDSDPQRRFKGLLGAEGREPVASPDGVHWNKLPSAKIPSSDTSTLVYDESRRRYIAVLKSFTKFGRSASISFSDDFLNWTPPRLCFSTDEADLPLGRTFIRDRLHDSRFEQPTFVDPEPGPDFQPPEGTIPTWRAECYALAIFPYEGVYSGLPMIYFPTGLGLPERNNTDGLSLIQLMTSRDFTEWKRLGDRRPFIDHSPRDKGLVGVFDRSQLIPPSRPIVRDDELWFYYTAFKTREIPYSKNRDGSPRDSASLTVEERADLDDGWSAICLAVLRRDGFVSLDARKQPGKVRTQLLRLAGNAVWVNVDVARDGKSDVVVLDANDAVMAQAETVTGDRRAAKLVWRSGDPTRISTEPVRLEFRLQEASLYSFWCE